ncbi:MAG: deoxyguanosinetriphosphate triphosphohydrolase [Eggerthellaceae bacterium]|nr:deoxyguanosinetriphosphate triphosphohydrolase [Eggerthellaceae bacterium]
MRQLLREDVELQERSTLASDASFSDASEGRASSSHHDYLRTEYQRDRDKIIHCKAFRRLSHKTQVFVAPKGDHFRSRLTHTLEVAQIARTLARALSLNEDLTEAIALGHDLGHTPFGHTGEDAICDFLAEVKGQEARPFRHNEQSLRVVEVIENGGRGLNLTAEVRDGILCHTGEQRSETLEGRIVAISDRIAYVNHDIDDAIRAGLLCEDDLPSSTHEVLGADHSSRIQTLVVDAVQTSVERCDIALSDGVWAAMMELRTFLFEHVYHCEPVMREVRKAYHLVQDLLRYYMRHIDRVPREYRALSEDDDCRAVCDYVAGMTDRFARSLFEELFIPHALTVPDDAS